MFFQEIDCHGPIVFVSRLSVEAFVKIKLSSKFATVIRESVLRRILYSDVGFEKANKSIHFIKMFYDPVPK